MQRIECEPMELGQGELRWRRINGTGGSGAGASELEQVPPKDTESPRCDSWRFSVEKGFEKWLWEFLTLWYIAEALAASPDQYAQLVVIFISGPSMLTFRAHSLWGKARFHRF